MADRLSQVLAQPKPMAERACRLDPERIAAMLPQPRSREIVDAAPAAETAVGDAPAPAVAAIVPTPEQIGEANRIAYAPVVARWQEVAALIAERDRLEAECRDLADKLDEDNVRYAQLFARCQDAERERDALRARVADLEAAAHLAAKMTLAGAERFAEAARERDEARAAGRATVAENAALRRERDALRAAFDYAEKEIAGVLAEAHRHAENARGGPPERGSEEKAAKPSIP